MFCRDTRQRYKNPLPRFLVEDKVLTGGRRCEFFDTHSSAYEAFCRIAPKHIPNQIDFENIERRNHVAVGLLIFGTPICSNFVATWSVPKSTVAPRHVPTTPFSVVEQCRLIPTKNPQSAYS